MYILVCTYRILDAHTRYTLTAVSYLDRVQFRGLAKHSQSTETRCRSKRKPEAGKAIWYPSDVADSVSYRDRTQNRRLS